MRLETIVWSEEPRRVIDDDDDDDVSVMWGAGGAAGVGAIDYFIVLLRRRFLSITREGALAPTMKPRSSRRWRWRETATSSYDIYSSCEWDELRDITKR